MSKIDKEVMANNSAIEKENAEIWKEFEVWYDATCRGKLPVLDVVEMKILLERAQEYLAPDGELYGDIERALSKSDRSQK